jgi:hypothetical protein
MEEPARRVAVPPGGGADADDLPDLVDRPVQVDPPTGDLDLGLVYMPAVADPCRPNRAASASSGVNRSTQRCTVT